MIARRVIEGRPATVAYVTQDMEPAEAAEADIMKVMFDNGDVWFLRLDGTQDEEDEAELTDKRPFDESKISRGQPENAGQFGPGGYSAKGKTSKPARATRNATETGATAAEVLAAARARTQKPAKTEKQREKVREGLGVTASPEEREIAASRERLATRQAEINAERGGLAAYAQQNRERVDPGGGEWVRHPEGGYQLTEEPTAPNGMTLNEMIAEADRLRVEREGASSVVPPERAPVDMEAQKASASGKKKTTRDDFEKAGINLRNYGDEDEEMLDDYDQFIGIPPAEFKKIFAGGMKGSMTISGDPRQDTFAVNGRIEGEGKHKGLIIGNFDRNINMRTKVAYSALFEIIDEAQGAGYGKRVLAGNIELYEKIGIEKVKVSAGLKMGGYAWAKFGYVPDQQSWNDLRAGLKRKAHFEPSGGGSTRREATEVEADDWSELNDDQQRETRAQWMHESHNEFVDSEDTNWRDSGQPMEEAKNQVVGDFNNADDDQWARDAIEEARESLQHDGAQIPFDDDTLITALSITYESRYQDGNGDLTVHWNDDKLARPKGVDKNQKTLPGIEGIAGHERLTEAMRNSIETMMKYQFERKAESQASAIDSPDFTDQVEEYQEQVWDSMDDSQRLEYAARYGHNMLEVEAEEEEDDNELEEGYEREASADRELLNALNSSDPKSIWKVADSYRGKELLMRTGWSGTLNLKDEEAMGRFRAYVAKGKK